MGTPAAAVPSLRALAQVHDVAAVYTQPDRPRGRGLEQAPSLVKEAALELGLPVVEPASLKNTDERDRLREIVPEIVCVVAFGQILPPEVLAIPPRGCVNVHFSLLPRWRGAAPVERAMMAGDKVTGVTTMLMDEGLDTGPILLQERERIEPGDTSGTLLERLSEAGARLLVATLEGLEDGTVVPRAQPDAAATYARKLRTEEAELHFELPAERLVDHVRALAPDPGAFTWFRARRLKVHRAQAVAGGGETGCIAALHPDGPEVQTGDGRLRLVEVQPEGKRRMSGADFVNGYGPKLREQLGVAVDAGR